MQYRTFGQLDWKPSALGFGCMRLPVLGEDSGAIDEKLAIEMIRHAIDSGLNYVDTAWGYHREQSEGLVGKALQDGYRQRVHLATKLPSWLVHSQEDMARLLDTQLERLQTDHVDFYLLHSMNQAYWENYRSLDVFSWAERKMAEGKIGHLGFSFHDRYEVFESILNGYDNWTFCQIQYNYMDINEQAGERGLNAAAEKGLAVVVMEPLRGGSLAKTPLPKPLEQAFGHAPRPWTPAEWALQWVWNQPEVSLLLSGMSTPEQVDQNLQSADRSGVGTLDAADLQLIAEVRAARQGLAPVACTRCEYCQPCPNGVSIPRIFEIYNNAVMYDNRRHGQSSYLHDLAPENRADACLACGECESICPQELPIIDYLKDAEAYLQGDAA